jgi:hypothetical protein
MDNITNGKAISTSPVWATASAADVRRDFQAYQILHWGLVILPILAGVDKFTRVLCDWTMYLSPPFAVFGPQTTMQVVGVIEIIAGLGVAFKPRFFAPVVAIWLWGIIANLLVLGGFYDIALRDLGLSLAALALWRLSQHFDVPRTETGESSAPVS